MKKAALILFLFLSVPQIFFGTDKEKVLTILFTNDIHSAADKYPQLAWLLKRERAMAEAAGSAVIIVDAGDVAMGTEYHTLFEQEGFEYQMLNKMGYDFYTFGNHDFEGGINGLASAVENYIGSLKREKRESQPGTSPKMLLLSSNCGLFQTASWRKLVPQSEQYIKTFAIVDKDSVKIALFGLMGDNALSSTLNPDSLVFKDRISTLRNLVKIAGKESPHFMIVLSHGGTSWVDGRQITGESKRDFLKRRRSEDGRVAANVKGIDVIISGHDHVALHTPLIVDKTVIGSTGTGLLYVGKMVFKGKKLIEYKLLPVSEKCCSEESIATIVDDARRIISESFRTIYGYSLNDTLCIMDKSLQKREALGRFIADSYVKAASIRCEQENIISIVPLGIIRSSLHKGAVTIRDVFRVLPLGYNKNGHSGYPLVMMWVNGNEVRDICEINASVASSESDMHLFFGGGITYRYNGYGIPFKKVTEVKIKGKQVESSVLYPVVTDIYTAKLVGLLKDSSFGLLSAEPKSENGSPIKHYEQYIIRIEGGKELTGWFALALSLKESGGAIVYDNGSTGIEEANHYLLMIYFIVIALISGGLWIIIRKKHSR